MRRRTLMAAAIAIGASLTLTGSLLAKGPGDDNGKGKKGSPPGKVNKPARTAGVITLPGTDQIFPEGIAAKGHWIYTGSSANGTIYRAAVKGKRKGGGTTAQVLTAGTTERSSAIGMKVDKRGHLVVAGGATGVVWILNRHTGATIGKLTQPAGQYDASLGTFLNDITIAKNGDAYVTDSFNPVIWRIPASFLANPTTMGVLEPWLPLTGTPIVYGAGFNLNGIVAWKNKYLVVVQSNTGKLFRIAIDSKQIVEVAVTGATLTGGDGLVLHDQRLYVVNSGEIDVLNMRKKLTKAKLRKTLTNATFDSPTTAVLHRGRMYVVNSQFGKGTAAKAPFTISVIKPNSGRH